MLLKYFYDEMLAQASYFVGCPAGGTAIVIDPARDITPYLEASEKHGLKIEYVTETHIHADFVSGIRELAHATGATMLLSDEGDEDWKYQFPANDKIQLLHEGDEIMVGGVKLTVMHTPGHTPESISFMVTDSGADEPMGIFTGDFLFVGDVGRPDLLEEAAGIMDTREVGAQQQFANVNRFKQLPEYLQIFPAHGAGSACGKALGAVPSTTLGYEMRFNPAFQHDNEDAFVDWLLEGQPEAPRYFARMKHVNKVGSPIISDLPTLERHTTADLPDDLVIDTRNGSEFAEAHLPNTVNIPASSGGFNTYVGWYVDFEDKTYLIAYDDQIESIMRALRAVGVDNVPAYYSADALDFSGETVPQQTPKQIYDAGVKIIDVRGVSEYDSEHIPGVKHIHMGKILEHLSDIPQDEYFAVQCGSGVRSQVVASLLQKHGYQNVINMAGGITAWKKANLPLEQN